MASKIGAPRSPAVTVIGIMILALGACSTPVPSSELRAAGDAVARAQADGAAQLAPQDLGTAQSKLANARSNVAKDDNDVARRLAEQAQVDAEYADASSNAQRISATSRQLSGAEEQLQQRLQQKP